MATLTCPERLKCPSIVHHRKSTSPGDIWSANDNCSRRMQLKRAPSDLKNFDIAYVRFFDDLRNTSNQAYCRLGHFGNVQHPPHPHTHTKQKAPELGIRVFVNMRLI